jgi:hypothetical protein
VCNYSSCNTDTAHCPVSILIISKVTKILDALGVFRRDQKGIKMRKAKKQARSKEMKRWGKGTIIFKN